MGTVTFVNLPDLVDVASGDMYNVSDQFTTTTDFKEGSGNVIPVGSNVYKTTDGYWDVLAGSPVTGVKGNAETSYRRGNVNITSTDIGLGNVDNTSDINKPISTVTQTALDNKVDKVSGKGLSANDYTTTEKNKLAGIATGAEVNQNAFSNITIGSTTIAADTTTDTLTLVAGNNVTLTPDATNDKVTITATDTTYTSLKNPYSLTIQGNGTTLTNGTYDGSAAKTVNITPSSIGAAAASHGTHVTYGTSASALGTSSAGTATTVSRSDHVHALPSLTALGLTATATELNYCDGVTSNIQTQIDTLNSNLATNNSDIYKLNTFSLKMNYSVPEGVTSANDLLTLGIYVVNTSITDLPSGTSNYGFIVCLPLFSTSSAYMVQLFINANATVPTIWGRCRNNSSWAATGWTKLTAA